MMNEETLQNYFTEILDEGIAITYNKGYEWYRDEFLPALSESEEILSNKKELLSDIWYLVGDIHDFNHAPLSAIEAYRKSISFDLNNASSFREIANMLSYIGKFDEALENINKSLELDPTEECAIGDKETIILFQNSPHLYELNDISFKMRECLAKQDFSIVIANFNSSKEIEELKILARAFGGLDLNKEYLETWTKISTLSKEFEVEYSDWFYMPTKIYNSAEIWLVLKAANKNIKPSSFPAFDSLSENYYSTLSMFERHELICDFYIFTAENNIDKLKLLKEKYPLWIELSEY